MNIDKKKLYMYSAVLVPAFLLVCLIGNTVARRLVLVALVAVLLAGMYLLVKKRTALSIHKKELLWVLPLFGFVGLVLLYLTGVSFGFHRVTVNLRSVLTVALPFALIIIGSELLRSVLLMQGKRAVSILSFIAFLCCDVAMLYQGSPLASHRSFVNFIGGIVFPCVSAAVLYHYVSKRYGALPVILYRLLMTLYRVLVPLMPAAPAVLLAFVRVLFPILAVFFIGLLYERKRKAFSRARTYFQISLTVVLILLMTATMMLVSCRFRYSLLVVATESMTGAINKGDAVIYERYDDGDLIEIGQVVVFEKNDTVYIHRVVKIQNIDGELRYITKGDANDQNDAGYITKENIIGHTDVTVKYIGIPTLVLRDLFKK